MRPEADEPGAELDLALLDGLLRAGSPDEIRRGVRTDLGVRAGKIVAIGPDVRARPAREVIQLGGATVCAGFIDSHTHLGWAGEALWNADAATAQTRTDLLAAVARASRWVGQNAWLLGGGWDRGRLPDAELPGRDDLDALRPDVPIFLRSADGGAAACNSLALKLMNLASEAEPHPPIAIERDEHGRPSGRMVGAVASSRATVGVIPPRDRWRLRAELRSALAMLASKGVTEVHDIATPEPRRPDAAMVYLERSFTSVAALVDLATADGLLLRVGVRPSLHRVDELAKEWFDAPTELLTWQGFKVFVGVGGYASAPGLGGHTYRYFGREQTVEWIRRAGEVGQSVSAHALGDLDVAEALDAFGDAAGSSTLAHRLVHARTMRRTDVTRAARLGVVAEMQPWDLAETAEELSGRADDDPNTLAYPWGSLTRAGVPVALGSDWRGAEHDDLRECDPLLGMYVAVERRAPGVAEPWTAEEGIDVAQALHGYTVGGAIAGRQSHRRGSLRVGQDADITVVSEDIVTGGPESLLRARILLTVVGGRTAFVA